MTESVIWHDLECGFYDLDLPLWRELAASARGPVLDIGAGSGRVALDLARRGHDVVALDRDAELLAALAGRANGLTVDVVTADARDFDLGRSFGLVLVPMQTIQLMDDAAERARVLECARAHAAPGAAIALAIADVREGYDITLSEPPMPDMREIDGTVYASRPVRIIDEGGSLTIERLRQIVLPDGTCTESADLVRLAHVTVRQLEDEGAALGLTVAARRSIPDSDEFVGSSVVMFDA